MDISPDRAQIMANKKAMQMKKDNFELENISAEGSIGHPPPRVDMWDVNVKELENEPKQPLQIFHEGSPNKN